MTHLIRSKNVQFEPSIVYYSECIDKCCNSDDNYDDICKYSGPVYTQDYALLSSIGAGLFGLVFGIMVSALFDWKVSKFHLKK